MLRIKISEFIKKNKNKIYNLLIKVVVVAILVFSATMLLSVMKKNTIENNTIEDVYKPKETIQKGSDISENQYNVDTNILDKFICYCNNGYIQNAYNMLSDECKETIYITIDIFKENYYNPIFKEKRVYALQSWISTNEYTVYKIRYSNDMLSTGTYQSDNVFEDYITLLKGSKREQISIGKIILVEDYNIKTNSNNIETKVIKKLTCLEYEEYEMYIKNNTNNTILLDELKSKKTIRLIDESENGYSIDTNKLFRTDLIIEAGENKRIKIRANKRCSIINKSKRIEFLHVIKDYNSYLKDKENYNNTDKIIINL